MGRCFIIVLRQHIWHFGIKSSVSVWQWVWPAVLYGIYINASLLLLLGRGCGLGHHDRVASCFLGVLHLGGGGGGQSKQC